MKPFVTLASLIVLIASASADGDDDYPKYGGGISYGPGISLGGGGLGGGSLGGGGIGGGISIGGIGGGGIGGGISGIGIGGPVGGIIGRGFGPASVSGTINPFGGVSTSVTGLAAFTPAIRGAAQGAATASVLGVLSGRPSRVSGVSVGTGGGRAVVSGSASPIGGFGGIVPYGSYGYGISGYGYGSPSYGVGLGGYGGYGNFPDLATFQGSTFGNLATGSINSAAGGIPYGGTIGFGYGGYGLRGGYGGLLGGYGGYGGLLGGYGYGLGGLGGSTFTGVSQDVPFGRAVMSGQAFGAGVPPFTVAFSGVGLGNPGYGLSLGGVGGGGIAGPIGGGGIIGPIGGGGIVGPIGGGGIVGPIGGGGVTIRKKKY